MIAGSSRRRVRLGSERGKGGSGSVFEILGDPLRVAKVYHDATLAKTGREDERKVRCMVSEPPDLSPIQWKNRRYVQIAWPDAVLLRDDKFAGFTMPALEVGRTRELEYLLVDKQAAIYGLRSDMAARVTVARNLSAMVAALHTKGHYVVDLKPLNLKYYTDALYMAVLDCDGFNIHDGATGHNYRAPVFTSEYLAPEFQALGTNPNDAAAAQDRFALAVIVFQLLCHGVHPYDGILSDRQALERPERIARGYYPYGTTSHPHCRPNPFCTYRYLPNELLLCFERAFLGDSSARPTAHEWADYLDKYAKPDTHNLIPCEANGAHFRFPGLPCSQCARERRSIQQLPAQHVSHQTVAIKGGRTPRTAQGSAHIEPARAPIVKSERAERETRIPLFAGAAAAGELPPLSLLQVAPPPTGKGYSEETLEVLSRQVEMKLKDFRIDARVVSAHPGPVITRFELEPAPGVRGSQISSLEKDIARELSLTSVPVVDVIPGKNVIGLEIPNAHREVVYLSEIFSAREYGDARSPLSLALGKDVGGRPVVVDLQKMPHLLVAGGAGSGMSTTVDAMVLSLLFKAKPSDVRLIMIDPKMLELSVYDPIPHLLMPVVTDMKEAANALRWCVAEMERRYKLMAAVGVRNLAGFNKKVRESEAAGQPLPDPLYKPNPDVAEDKEPPLEALPYIVVIIDEFADMMMIVGKKVEELIPRLLQKGRAAGVHLILATQRPSTDVITDDIEESIPTRIALKVSSKIDSRTILDQPGAETLLGNGDMLYLPPGAATPERVHGAFVGDHDVRNAVEWLRWQGELGCVDAVLEEVQTLGDGKIINGSGLPEDAGGGERGIDVLYDRAVHIVTSSRRASISGVQRHLRIDYNRAARLIEMMEQDGVVTPPQHNGQREVLVPPPKD